MYGSYHSEVGCRTTGGCISSNKKGSNDYLFSGSLSWLYYGQLVIDDIIVKPVKKRRIVCM